jgi:hypothetical protein
MATTRRDLRLRLGGVGYCNDTVVTSATGGDSTKILATTLKQLDNAFNYGQVVVVTGSAAGDRRVIADWVQSTGTLTPDRNFTGAIASGNTFEIHRLFAADDKDAAISEVIRASDRRFCRPIENESVTLSAATFGYSLDSLTVPVDRLHGIDRIEYATGASGTTPPWQPYKSDWWKIRDNNGALTLQLTRLPVTSQKLRLIYQVRPGVLDADTSALDPDDTAFAEYICSGAAGLLFERKAQIGEDSMAEANQQIATRFRAESYLRLASTGTLPIQTVKGKG